MALEDPEMDAILLEADTLSDCTTSPQRPKLQFNAPRAYNNRTKQLSSPLVPQSSEPSTPSRGTDRPSRVVITETPPTSPHLTTPTAIVHHRATPPPDSPVPFIRPPFPAPLNPRSPIPGPRAGPVLRVCLRLGEALRAAAADARARTASHTELYARVVRSERLGVAQHFRFADLYHWGRPPVLEGRWTGWAGAPCWEADGAAFLGALGAAGKMCRAVGRIERLPEGGGWRMSMLSVWEADWEDVEAVKQVICV